MKKKTYQILVSCIFCIFVGGMALLSLLLPDRSFSELENRNLQPLPELTANRVTSGRFMSEAEDYVSDHIALRDQWVSLQAWCERISGKQENRDTYFGVDGTLINAVPEPDPELQDKNMGYLNDFTEEITIPVYFGLIPTAASVWREKLPAGAPTADEQAWIDSFYAVSDAETIDLYQALRTHEAEEIYYRTDHHWTSLGAFYGANAILDQTGLQSLNMEDYIPETVSDCFYGTTYSSSGAWWVEPDHMERYVPEDGITVISNFTGKEEPGSLYVPDRLVTKNKYGYFLGGNQPLCVVKSGGDGPKLLVIRDSYSDCLAPFLSQRFSEVHLFDLRYNRTSLRSYLEDHQIDMVLILYSFSNFTQENNLFLLTR